ncbi:MAG TPA: hypothetical protein DEA96_02185 [Leptospiraceae bacterium]|nr:hypothetical protein [Spirochaetaceae bacterium]HBS03744.1 hypothetical protein [Leptospiraceae bacterium]
MRNPLANSSKKRNTLPPSRSSAFLIVSFCALLIATAPVVPEESEGSSFLGAFCADQRICMIFFPGEFGHLRGFVGARKQSTIVTVKQHRLFKIIDEKTLSINGRCLRYSDDCFDFQHCNPEEEEEPLDKKFCRVPYRPDPDRSDMRVLTWPAPLES